MITFTRMVFAFALLMLVVGILGSRELARALLPAPPEPRIEAAVHTATATPLHGRTHNTPVPVHTRVVVTGVRQGVPRHLFRRRRRLALRPTATPIPTPTRIAGTVALTNYWVGSLRARPGQTIAVGYVIDNTTGRTQRIMLGASVKSIRVLSWAAGAISDPYHDVVAVVPPGVSVHTRYFTLPSGLRRGTYDIAWGLRNSSTGRRDALVAAPAVLHIIG